MYYKKSIYIRVIVIIFIFFICGCSNFGKLRRQSKYDDGVDLDYLINNLSDYDIYYSGYSLEHSSGILFDPKYDGDTIKVSDAWKKIEGRQTVSTVVTWVSIPDTFYVPTLYRILGPDDKFFGYMFTGWSFADIKVINPETLFVYELDVSPVYLDPWDRW